MSDSITHRLLSYVKDVAFEILWPTRCAICDSTGDDVICDECKRKLRFIDRYEACSRCGAPHGSLQCTECNDLVLGSSGLEAFPLDSMSHAMILDDAAKRIVTAYKDQGERRLCDFIGEMIGNQIDPNVHREGFAITYIPDTARAFRRRGFDHSQEIANEVSRLSGIPCIGLFKRPKSIDQRKLGRASRIGNMANRLAIEEDAEVPSRLIIIDDVCTTGATIYSACLELQSKGAEHIRAVTFGRVLA